MEEFMLGRIQEILGSDAQSLLNHQCKTISKDKLHLPGPDFIIGYTLVRTVRSVRWSACSSSSSPAGSQARVTFRFCRWIRESSTLLVHRLLPIRFISILRTL